MRPKGVNCQDCRRNSDHRSLARLGARSRIWRQWIEVDSVEEFTEVRWMTEHD